jgi:DNA-binding MarR family transcriptional regulator
MPPAPRDLEALIRLIRLAFNRLRARADALHADLGVSAGMRAVLESLAESGAQTVPDMARTKSVSRQHIQVIADALIAAGLVAPAINPRHKRSVLIDLTPAGRRVFAEVRKREGAELRCLASRLPDSGLAAALKMLDALAGALDTAAETGE